MAKKIKTGNVEVPASNFDGSDVKVLISILIPEALRKDLKRLSLTEEFGGKYQVLVRKILEDYVEAQKPKRKRA